MTLRSISTSSPPRRRPKESPDCAGGRPAPGRLRRCPAPRACLQARLLSKAMRTASSALSGCASSCATFAAISRVSSGDFCRWSGWPLALLRHVRYRVEAAVGGKCRTAAEQQGGQGNADQLRAR